MTSFLIGSMVSLLILTIAIQYIFYKKCHPNGENRKCCCSE